MIVDEPVEFAEALRSREVRGALPTTLGAAELAELSAEVRDLAVFSARMTSAEYLQEAADVIEQLLRGETDGATAALALKDFLAGLGYREGGAEWDLRDHTSFARRRLVLDMGVRMAQGYGAWRQGQDPDLLDMWPCWELYRQEDRVQKRAWPTRWTEAGGRLWGLERRMIARKDDPIWEDISEFGRPYPPFAYGSGMWTRDVSREEAEALGVIGPEEVPEARDDSLLEGWEATPEVKDERLRTALAEALGGTDFELAAGVLRRKGGAR